MSWMRAVSFRSWVPSALRATVLLLVAGVVVGCSGGDGTVDPPGDNPSFTLSLSNSTLTITQGANGTVTVTITRNGGFAGAVAVAVEGLPQGVTAGALNIAAGSTSGVLELTAVAGATVGGAQLTVRGTGSGVDPKTAALGLTVNASTPNPTPDFTLSLSPTSGSAAQGATTQTTVTIARTGGFTGAVTLSASGLPSGVTAAFNPTAPTGATSAVTFTIGGSAAVGTYPITIQGTGSGVPNRSAAYSLQVTAGSTPGSGNTTFEFCSASGLPIWAAAKNGNGAWTRVTGTNGVYSFQIDGSGGIAWVYEESGGYSLSVIYGTQAELNSSGGDRCVAPGTGKTVNASVPGLGPTDIAVISLGSSFPNSTPTSATPNIVFSKVPSGSVDLIAGRSALDFGTLSIVPQRYLIKRGLNPAEGSNIGPIDFAGADGFNPVMNTLTLLGVTGSQVVTTTSLRTAGGSFGNLSGGGTGGTWYGVPAARLQPGDLHVLSATSTTLVALAPTQTTLRFIANPGPVTLNVGPALTAPTVTPLTATGYARAQAQYAIQTQYGRFWMANFQQTNPSPYRAATVQMSQAFRGSGTGTVTLEIPNFTGVDGWNAIWGLQSGQQLTWTFSGIGWDGPGGFQPLWQDGNTYVTATHMGQFTP